MTQNVASIVLRTRSTRAAPFITGLALAITVGLTIVSVILAEPALFSVIAAILAVLSAYGLFSTRKAGVRITSEGLEAVTLWGTKSKTSWHDLSRFDLCRGKIVVVLNEGQRRALLDVGAVWKYQKYEAAQAIRQLNEAHAAHSQ